MFGMVQKFFLNHEIF